MARMVLLYILVGACISGCSTVRNADRTPSAELAEEGSIVVVRPDRYTILGTRSIRDYIEVTYEQAARNGAGQLVVQLGLRNRGGQHFWDTRGPKVNLSVKAVFFSAPITGSGPSSPPVYETNWQVVHLNRGETEHLKYVCPVQDASGYQVTISEILR